LREVAYNLAVVAVVGNDEAAIDIAVPLDIAALVAFGGVEPVDDVIDLGRHYQHVVRCGGGGRANSGERGGGGGGEKGAAGEHGADVSL
jgi:hypothetical protein